MEKKKSSKSNRKSFVPMEVVNPNAAGIDVGDTIHAVAVPKGRDDNSVLTFGTMNCDLKLIVEWLDKCQVDTVALESTGVYWKPLFSYLTQNGFEVYLVNARHVRNVTGKKSDQSDAEWLQQLHSCGLVKSSYLPEDHQDSLRSLVRYRRTLTEDSSRCVLRMQKALELMNIKIHTVISDIVGKTGTAIVQAIINGERSSVNFLPLIDGRIKADHVSITKSLEGNWRDEHLYMLEDNYKCYQFYLERISSCDKAIEEQLEKYSANQNDGEIIETVSTTPKPKMRAKKINRNTPLFDVRKFLKNIHGVDVLNIYGISDIGALEILAETGTDMSKWKNEKHFVSWLNLCPNNKISGGKLISSMLMKKKPNQASQSFRMAANAIQRSDNWLGDYFRRMKSKGGNRYAIVATANKIATIYYKMISSKKEFNPIDLQQYQEQRKSAKIAYLERKLIQLKSDVA